MLKVHHNRLLHQPINALDKVQMRRVFADIVIPILDRGELDNETVRDAILFLVRNSSPIRSLRGNLPATSPGSYPARPLAK